MTLEDYLAFCPDIDTGIESLWLDFCMLTVPSGKLIVMDPTLFDGPAIDLDPGEYRVQAKVFEWPNDRRVSRLRAFRGEAPTLGARIDEVGVDFAQVALGDCPAVSAAADALDGAAAQTVIASLDAGWYGIAQWADGVHTPWVKSGFGDGCYPIFELIQGSVRVGVEVEFIDQYGL